MTVEVFPTLAGLEYPVMRTPIAGRTLIQTSVSGRETRAALWTVPRWQYTLSFNFLRDDANNEFRTLVAFILARQGSYDPFLYNDIDDNQVTAQEIGLGDGTTTSFQLVRSFNGFTEPVLAPQFVNNVTVGGVPKTFGADWGATVWRAPPAPGVITFTTPPASGAAIVCDIAYFWPCRFLADQYDFSKFMNRLWEQKKLDFITLKND